tara:strand:+ start:98 stop:376 length:279 start_codon:yes stop_codon:yes gene_type:complete
VEITDQLDLILLKVKDLDKKINKIQETVESHRLEHGFQKMQDGGINQPFAGEPNQGPPTGMPPGMGGMGAGYQMPGMGAPPMGGDASRPPGM